MARGQTSKGKQRIPIQLIENAQSRQVCFSKRRAGLFKKAMELSVLCGAEVAVLAFSPGGKPFSFGSPSFDAIVDRFLTDGRDHQPTMGPAQYWWDEDVESLGLEELLAYEKALLELRSGLQSRPAEADLAIVPYGVPAMASSSPTACSSSATYCSLGFSCMGVFHYN